MDSFTAGVSFPVGDGSEYWNTGFSLGINGFTSVSRNNSFLIGVHFAYNRWTPDEDELTKDHRSSGWDVIGHLSIIEVVPSIRLLTKQDKTQDINLFGQLGFGIFF